MLRSTDQIIGCEAQATDGRLGEVSDLFFDEYVWKVRYLVVKAGTWLSRREVLLSPEAVGEPDWENGVVTLGLRGEEVRTSPAVESELPVSRRKERELAEHYDWVPYWSPISEDILGIEQGGPSGLRSVEELEGYVVEAGGRDVGAVEDFLVDPEVWAIRYMRIHLGLLVPGKTVLIAPEWAEDFQWLEARVRLECSAEELKNAPEYDETMPVDRVYEEQLHEHYGRQAYWE